MEYLSGDWPIKKKPKISIMFGQFVVQYGWKSNSYQFSEVKKFGIINEHTSEQGLKSLGWSIAGGAALGALTGGIGALTGALAGQSGARKKDILFASLLFNDDKKLLMKCRAKEIQKFTNFYAEKIAIEQFNAN